MPLFPRLNNSSKIYFTLVDVFQICESAELPGNLEFTFKMYNLELKNNKVLLNNIKMYYYQLYV